MRRRELLFYAGTTLSLPGLVSARQSCGPVVPPGRQFCQVGIDSSVASVTAAQRANEWCWAASIETIFRYYGHPVRQERIVAEAWGRIVDLPGGPQQIMRSLNRHWRDDNDDEFDVSADAYSANAVTASQDLANDMPLVIGTMGHAMVLTAMTFVQDAYGNGQVVEARVRDPWPGRGLRVLSPQEWYSVSFLARIRVE